MAAQSGDSPLARRRITLIVRAFSAGGITFSLDGDPVLTAVDPDPAGAGLLGLRTYRTYLWWDNIRLERLGSTAPGG